AVRRPRRLAPLAFRSLSTLVASTTFFVFSPSAVDLHLSPSPGLQSGPGSALVAPGGGSEDAGRGGPGGAPFSSRKSERESAPVSGL
ncbi:hypothetical protein GWI33_009643, partial [Rhynchophorus ferrugineus]